MVPENQGAGHAREQAQPRPYRAYLPEVADPSASILSVKLPAADAGHVATRFTLDQAGLAYAGDANIEAQAIAHAALPDEALDTSDAVLIASLERLHIHQSGPPIGPVQRIGQRLENLVDRRLEMPGGIEIKAWHGSWHEPRA